MSLPAPLWRDSNRVAIQSGGVVSKNAKTLVGSNATVAVPIFGITGTVSISALYGVVTTVLGVNVTTAYWRLKDDSTSAAITNPTGQTLSAMPVGSAIAKNDLAAIAMIRIGNGGTASLAEPAVKQTMYFSPFIAMQKTGGIASNIEFVYTTTDTPTSGAIQFFVCWLPVSQNGSVSIV